MSAEALTDRSDGLLDTGRAAEVDAHLARCATCRGLYEQARYVRSVLASLPAPALPEEVCTRLDVVLAEARHEHLTAPVPRRTRLAGALTSHPPLLAGAAVLVVVLVSVSGYLAVRGGASGTAAQRPSPGTAVTAPFTTGHHYRSDQLTGAVHALLQRSRSGAATPPYATGALLGGEVGRLADPDAFADCLHALTGGDPGSRTVAADLGAYDGTPAAIVVLTVPGDHAEYQVVAVGAGCAGGNAQVLDSDLVPR